MRNQAPCNRKELVSLFQTTTYPPSPSFNLEFSHLILRISAPSCDYSIHRLGDKLLYGHQVCRSERYYRCGWVSVSNIGIVVHTSSVYWWHWIRVEHLRLESSPIFTLEHSLVVMPLSSWWVSYSGRMAGSMVDYFILWLVFIDFQDHWDSVSIAFWSWKWWSPQLRFSAGFRIHNIVYCRISDGNEACFSGDWLNRGTWSRFCACSS